MRHHNNRITGLCGVVLLGALAVGAANATAGADDARAQKPAKTAALNDAQLQVASAEFIDPNLANGADASSVKVAGGCTAIVVGATELVFSDRFEAGDTGAWEPGAPARFSAIRMLDLNLTIRFVDGFDGDHLLHLKLFTPKGHHYQTLSAPITSDLGRDGSLRRVEGYPRPLEVLLLQETDSLKLPKVTLSIPVGGTPIVANSIYGMWTAEAYLDEQTEACASQPFVLSP